MADERKRASSKPELRHEFVAMIFAVTIGEVGVQLSGLVKQPSILGFLPCYSHLFLATILIAASFVGWTQSPSEGARRDVRKVLEWEFLVLLVDALLVVCYFILVRAVDFSSGEGGNIKAYNPSAFPEAGWIVAIFSIYFLWDLVTKLIITPKSSEEVQERDLAAKTEASTPETIPAEERAKRNSQRIRVFVTAICLGLAIWAVLWMKDARLGNVVLADLGLAALVLLFRAMKDVASAFWPGEQVKGEGREKWLSDIAKARKQSSWATGILLALFGFSLLWAHHGRSICPALDAVISHEVDRAAAGEKRAGLDLTQDAVPGLTAH